jgi:hypothetical protein
MALKVHLEDPMNSRLLPRLVLAALGASVLLVSSGCFVRPGYAGATVYGDGYAQGGVTVYQQPPQARVVVRPMAPQQGYVWVEGNWNWNGAQWVWADGYWTAPRVGYTYAQPRWEQRGRGWVHVGGGWRGGEGRVVVQPGYREARPQQYRGGGTVQVTPGAQPAPYRGGGTVMVQPGQPVPQQYPPGRGRGRGSVQVRPGGGEGRGDGRGEGRGTVEVR